MTYQSSSAGLDQLRTNPRPVGRNRARNGVTQRMVTRSRPLNLLIDAIVINVSFVIGYIMRYEWQWFREVGFEARLSDYWPIQVAFTLTLLILYQLDGVYANRRAPSWLDQMYAIINGTAKGIIIVLALIFIFRPLTYSRLLILQAGIITIVLLGATRWVRGLIEARLRRQGVGVARVLIVGAGELGRAVMRVIVARPELGYQCVGFVDDDPERGATNIGRFAALGSLSCLPDILERRPVDEVVVTLPWSAQPKIMQVVRLCEARGVRVRVAPSLLQLNLNRIDVDDFGGIPLLTAGGRTMGSADLLAKRLFDLFGASLALLLTWPIILLTAILVRLESPGSPIFSQVRVGQDGRRFKIYKLRSMRADADALKNELLQFNEADGPLFKMRNDPRLTKIGRIIRRLSIDELLQFWNVLRGDMSIVGPRPNLPEEVARYADWQRERLRVKPGITGLSQISGRSELTFDETCLLDIYYIENWSLSLDIKIALKTIPYLLSARGAY
ncbi:MAG: sugar transferase [Anaerolineae bacterium]|nr:sugar transferase [Thermoflexales bacterium]MDW8406479.1 sugar transferase [Anaerolineae bacterium]